VRIVHITAGAGGRICGSCLHDNALVRALRARGRDALLVPAYVPTTTDEENVAERRVVLGGVNVWLQEHVALFRHTPWFLDRLLDARGLLAWLSARTGETRPADLGPLTVSALEGERGRQRKEVEKLARWLAADMKPDVVHLSNVLLSGLARRVREATGAAVVCTLSGEDLFIGQLPEPHRSQARKLLAANAAAVDRFVALNRFYADLMAAELAVPRERIAVVTHGVDPTGHPVAPPDLVARRRGRGGRFTVGFLSRACPEKGLHVLVDALGRMVAAGRDVEVVAAGATVAAERRYIDTCHRAARDAGVADRFRWLGEVERAGKLDLFAAVDCLALPAVHPEAKGIPALEAFTAGLPVVAADAGAFPEYVAGEPGETPTGLLHRPADAADLARVLGELQADQERAAEFGRTAFARARDRFTPDRMAAGHEAVYRDARRSPA